MCRLLNFDDRSEANTSAEQYKDAEQNKFQRENADKQGMPGPNMSLAYRDDEIERQNFANEATLRFVPKHCLLHFVLPWWHAPHANSMHDARCCCHAEHAPLHHLQTSSLLQVGSVGCASMTHHPY